MHLVGIIQMMTIILVGLNYTKVRSVIIFYAGLPILMEIAVGFYSIYYFRVMDYISERRDIRRQALANKLATYRKVPVEADEQGEDA